MLNWKDISSKIMAANGDQAKITQVLSDLETEVTTFNTRFTDLEKQTTDQAGQIDSLQKTNMNLFLKVGQATPQPALQTEKHMSYEDLLNNWDSKGE